MDVLCILGLIFAAWLFSRIWRDMIHGDQSLLHRQNVKVIKEDKDSTEDGR